MPDLSANSKPATTLVMLDELQALAPVETRIDEQPATVCRAPTEGIEVGEEVGSDAPAADHLGGEKRDGDERKWRRAQMLVHASSAIGQAE